jgi:hypothetical protein
MPILFPENPTVFETYVNNGITWTWTGSRWEVTGGTSGTGNLQAITTNVVPNANVTLDLGTTNRRWRDLYLSGNSIILGGATLTSTGSAVNLPLGSTIGGGNIASGGDVATGGGPKITNLQVTDSTWTVLDDTAVDTAGGYIKITGTGFAAGCQVLVNNVPATSTTFVSATEVRAQVPATAAGTYVVYLVNADGGVAIRVNGITFSATPTWVTGSTLAGDVDSAISIQLSATSATTYSLQAGSTLPTGLTLSAGGLISGTVTGLTNDTSYSFTVVATDSENQDSPRTFTITITTAQKVARSLRFNYSGRSTDLSRTFASAGNRKVWTYSVWFKRSRLNTTETLFSYSAGSTDTTWNTFWLTNDNVLRLQLWNSFFFVTTQVFTDTAAWYHAVLSVNTNDATASDRIKIYINGNRVTNFSSASNPSLSYDTPINNSGLHYIGKSTYDAKGFDGYMAEVYFIDGQALTPSSFSKTDPNTGQYIPKLYTGTYGTNGFYLNFSDNSATTATTLGKDSSGNNNNWTPNAFSVATGSGNDSLVDSPTSYGTDTGLGGEVRGNYCTLNPLSNGGTALTNGNLTKPGGDGVYTRCNGTMAVSSGKWYFEATLTTAGTVSQVGVGQGFITNQYVGQDALSYSRNLEDGNTSNNNVSSGNSAAYSVGDVCMCALDLDNNKVWFGKNGVWINVGANPNGNPAAGTNPAYNITAGTYTPITRVYGSGVLDFNFGQRPFAYAAPSGFKALCTHNLPTPAVVQSNTAFDAVAYTGNNGTQSITGLAFSPDFVWSKCRNVARSYRLTDIVRGSTKELYSDTIAAETNDGSITSFTATGFNLDNATASAYNTSGENYVSWCWDAGTATVTNNSGSIASQVRANPAAGFSIVSYASGSSGDKTVGHGLGQTPRFIITKTRNGSTYNWSIYHVKSSTALTQFLRFTTDSIVTSGTNIWGSAFPTSSVFGITSGNGVEANTDCIAYCFAEISGFSAFNSYTGNGSADGPFVYTGFRPRFILTKRSSTVGAWHIYDTQRSPFNLASLYLAPNQLNTEYSGDNQIDILSNGFKLRSTNTGTNENGTTIIYAAFAEQPFKYSRAR